MKRCLLFLVIAAAANGASAVVLEDFEDGYIGQGTVLTDPADPANNVLHLVSNGGGDGMTAEIFSIDTHGLVGTITMDIYDFGATREDSPPFGGAIKDLGPRWGILGDSDSDGTMDNWVAAGIVQTQWAAINTGYTYLADPDATDGNYASSFNGDWWSAAWFGNPRRVRTTIPGIGEQPYPGNGIQEIGTGTADAPDTPGTGAWTTWDFTIDESGNVSITAREGTEGKFLDAPYADTSRTDYNPGTGAFDMTIDSLSQIWVTGGHSSSLMGTHGVLVDNVTFDGAMIFSPTDFNTDGNVDGTDFDIWQASFGTDAGGDADGDGDTDGADFLTWQTEFGGGPGLATTAIPEPTTWLLAIGLLLGVAIWRRIG